MKVYVLGANSAFSTGEYEEAVTLADLSSFINDMKEKGKSFSHSDLVVMFSAFAKNKKRKLYQPAWQSNFLLEFDQPNRRGNDSPFRFVLDFGSDFRHSLQALDLDPKDIDAYFASHPHDDHIGGIEGIALKTFFNPFFTKEKAKWLEDGKKPIVDKITWGAAGDDELYKVPEASKPLLYGEKKVLKHLWYSAKPGLLTLQGVRKVELSTYFAPKPMVENKPLAFKDGQRTWKAFLVMSIHVVAGDSAMPSYGLMFECSDGTVVFFPTDTQFMVPPQLRGHFEKSTVIFQDTETSPFPSGVHTRLDELKALPANLKAKMILYHYDFESPPANSNKEFRDVAKDGSIYDF